MRGSKNCIIFKGLSKYNMLNTYIDCICRELEQSDYNVDVIDVSSFDSDEAVISKLMLDFQNGCEFILSFNATCIELKYNGIPLYDFAHVPYLTILDSHPIHLYDKLSSNVSNAVFAFTDRTYVEAFSYMFPGKTACFIPHAAYAASLSITPPSYDDRTHNILYCGDILDLNIIRKRWTSINNQGIKKLCDDSLELMVYDEKATLFDTIQTCAKRIGYYPNDDFFEIHRPLIVGIDNYVKSTRRHMVMKYLIDAGIKIECYGKGWENTEFSGNPSFVLNRPLDFHDMVEVVKNSKMVINVMSNTQGGVNELLLTAMINGTVCVTDTSTYLEDSFVPGRDYIPFEYIEIHKLPKLISDMLETKHKLKLIAANAYEKVKYYHTWNTRITDILNILSIHRETYPSKFN